MSAPRSGDEVLRRAQTVRAGTDFQQEHKKEEQTQKSAPVGGDFTIVR